MKGLDEYWQPMNATLLLAMYYKTGMQMPFPNKLNFTVLIVQ